MPDREAFFAAIRARPDDDGPRLVYADWLEERGDVAHAELIRVQCELARCTADDDVTQSLRRREKEILDENWQEWFGEAVVQCETLSDATEQTKVRRGFLEQITCAPEHYVRHEAVWARFAPVLSYEIFGGGPDLARIADLPTLSQWVSFSPGFAYSAADVAGFRAVINSSRLTNLRQLAVIESYIGPDGLLAIADSPARARLMSLFLEDVTDPQRLDPASTDAALRRLFTAPGSFPLEELFLRIGPALGGDALGVMLASPHTARLRRFGLFGRFAAEDIRRLTRSPQLDRVEFLEIGGWEFDRAGLAELGRWPLRGSLTQLSLPVRGLNAGEVGALTVSPGFARISYLNAQLATDEAVATLAASRHATGLRHLRLVYFGRQRPPLTSAAVRAIADSPNLTALEGLELLGCCDCDATDIELLRRSPRLPALRHIVPWFARNG